MSADKEKKTAAETEPEIVDEVCAEEIKSDEIQPEETAAKDDKKSKKGRKEAKKEENKEEAKEEVIEAHLSPEMAVLTDKYLRVCAEYDNFRRRSQKEKEALYGDIKADVLLKFLPVYDNLVRALSQPTTDEAYRKGVEMIMGQFVATMEKLGVEKIESLGHSFDPNLHNAVMHVDDEEKGENEIVEVFQEGFKCGEKVIRFAMVKVAN